MYLFDFSQFQLNWNQKHPSGDLRTISEARQSNDDAGPNVHLEHAEDAIFDEGHEGGRSAAHYIHSLANGLRGKHGPDFKVTTKYDGAPAVIFGVHPVTGKFFVGTKSVFAKTPKINYSLKDIERNHGDSPGLVTKLQAAFTNLRKLNIPHGEVYQGDMMYTPDDIKLENIEGKEHLTFTPNTLTYAVPHGGEDAKRIAASKMGIIIHTGYRNFGQKGMTTEFSPDLSHIEQHPHVWMKDAQLSRDGDKQLSAGDHKKIVEHLKAAHKHLDDSKDFIGGVAGHATMRPLMKMFVNDMVKRGIEKPTRQHVTDFITARHNAEADKLKTQAGKDRVHARRTELLSHLMQNGQHIDNLLAAHHNIAAAKHVLIGGLKKTKGIATYARTQKQHADTKEITDHLEPVAPEGFVMIDTGTGKALKAVNRSEFSRMNFERGKMAQMKKEKQQEQQDEGEENG
jgi:hypothetical protein